MNNIEIAKETLKIIENGYYFVNNRERQLHLESEDIINCELYDIENISSIVEDDDEYFEQAFWGYPECAISVENADSFEIAGLIIEGGTSRTLVLNFANAYTPGGGFLKGANAQEESLCRCSTLYASLSSKSAEEFYLYNIDHREQLGSDYLLLSPEVEVFRDVNGKLLDRTFVTSVITSPAPNLRSRDGKVSQDIIDCIMIERIKNIFMVAARNNYSDLILGAWGFGAFGHDAKRVAGYFKEVIMDEKYYQFFSSITFAVMDTSKDHYNYNSFYEVFGQYVGSIP